MRIYSDNDIMKNIQMGSGLKQDIPDISIQNLAVNWSKTASKEKPFEEAAQRFADLRKQGFSNDQAFEVLEAKGCSREIIERLASAVEQYQGLKKTASTTATSVVLPKQYKDVAEHVRGKAIDLGGEAFVHVLTAGNNPEVGIAHFASTKAPRELMSIVGDMQGSTGKLRARYASEFDQTVSPYINDEIEKSHLLAQYHRKHASVVKDEMGRTVVSINGEPCVVNLGKMTCTCDRNMDSNLHVLGLPCEHIVIAADEFWGDDEAELTEELEDMVGIDGARKLLQLWKVSRGSGGGRGLGVAEKSRIETFIEKAEREGFPEKAVDIFLSLQ